jgi:hypothetical protein
MAAGTFGIWRFSRYFFPGLESDVAVEKVIDLLLKTGGSTVEGITLEQLKKGSVRLKLGTAENYQIPFYEQIEQREPFPPVSLPVKIEQTAQFLKSGRI